MDCGPPVGHLEIEAAQDFLHDRLAVQVGILLDDRHVMQIIIEELPFAVGQRFLDAVAGQSARRFMLVKFGGLLAQVAAAGVHDDIEPVLLVPVGFDEMVAATQGANAELGAFQIDRLAAAQLIQVDFLQIGMGAVANVETAGNGRMDEAVQLVQLQPAVLQDHGFHAAANVDANQVGHHLVGDGHRCPDCAAGAGMGIRHDPDFTGSGKGLVQQTDDLFFRLRLEGVGKHFGAVVAPF